VILSKKTSPGTRFSVRCGTQSSYSVKQQLRKRLDLQKKIRSKKRPMTVLRRRVAVFSFFSLISLGQAYPFAVAWGMAKENHPCCCSGITKPCDCDHRHGAAGRIKGCHQDRRPGFSPAPCGGKAADEFPNFKGEPFVSPSAFSPLSLDGSGDLIELSEESDPVHWQPEAPPPKESPLS